MVTVMPEQGQPLPSQQTEQQPIHDAASAPAETQSPSLDSGFVQAPESTENPGVEAQGAPEQPQEQAQPEQPQHPQVSYEEYQQIQKQLQEKEDLFRKLEELAAKQRREEEERQFNDNLRRRIQEDIAKRVANADDDNEVVEAVYGLVNDVLGNTRSQYEQQMQQYYEQTQQAMWAAVKPNYADHLMQEYKLPPSIKANLLAFNDEQTMTLAAAQMAEALRGVQGAVQQQQVAQQVQQRQESGAFIPSGANGGPTPQEPMKPGTARELAPTLARILGVR